MTRDTLHARQKAMQSRSQPQAPVILNGTELLTEAQFAESLQICIVTARRWRKAGTGPRFIRLGQGFYYTPAAIADFLADSTEAIT